MTSNPTTSLKEEIATIFETLRNTFPEYAEKIEIAVMSAFTQAIERAEPKIPEHNADPHAPSMSEINMYENGVSDYKQRLLAEVK